VSAPNVSKQLFDSLPSNNPGGIVMASYNNPGQLSFAPNIYCTSNSVIASDPIAIHNTGGLILNGRSTPRVDITALDDFMNIGKIRFTAEIDSQSKQYGRQMFSCNQDGTVYTILTLGRSSLSTDGIVCHDNTKIFGDITLAPVVTSMSKFNMQSLNVTGCIGEISMGARAFHIHDPAIIYSATQTYIESNAAGSEYGSIDIKTIENGALNSQVIIGKQSGFSASLECLGHLACKNDFVIGKADQLYSSVVFQCNTILHPTMGQLAWVDGDTASNSDVLVTQEAVKGTAGGISTT
jgi:hypothetical protein